MSVKAIAIAVLLFICGLALWGFGRHEYKAGAQSVQVQWDQAKQAASTNALGIAAGVIAGDQRQAGDFISIDSTFQKATANASHAPDPFLTADYSGANRLRSVWQCPGSAAGGGARGGNAVPAATAGARRPHGAAAAPLEQREQAAIAAIRVGRDADRREARDAAQIEGLQALVRNYEAMGSPSPATSAAPPALGVGNGGH